MNQPLTAEPMERKRALIHFSDGRVGRILEPNAWQMRQFERKYTTKDSGGFEDRVRSFDIDLILEVIHELLDPETKKFVPDVKTMAEKIRGNRTVFMFLQFKLAEVLGYNLPKVTEIDINHVEPEDLNRAMEEWKESLSPEEKRIIDTAVDEALGKKKPPSGATPQATNGGKS